MWNVLALGEVVGDYTNEPAFEDVEGWDLQHVRRVRWRQVDVEPIRGLTRGTLNRVHGVSALLEEMWERSEEPAGELPAIPEPGRELKDGLRLACGSSSSLLDAVGRPFGTLLGPSRAISIA